MELIKTITDYQIRGIKANLNRSKSITSNNLLETVKDS